MISCNTMLSRLKLSKLLFCQRYQFRYRLNIRYVSEFEQGKLVRTIFSQTENNVLYEHLKSRPNYRQTLAFLDYVKEKSDSKEADAILNEDFSRIRKHELVDNFKSVCHSYCCDADRLNHPKFVEFCEYLIGEIPQLQDGHLLNILKVLTLWPRTENGNVDLFYRICKAVDEEACKRKSVWNRDQLLLAIDHFRRLGVMNYSDFAWQNLGRLCRSPGSLTANQLVHTLFLVMCNRKWHPGVNHFEWENALATIIYELSVEEATIVALGFFKTNKKITNHNLLNALIMKLESRADTLDSVSLTALLKVIRFSLPSRMRLRLIPLLDKLKEVIDEQTLTCCIHIASLGTRRPVFHEEVLNKIYSRFVKEVSTARLKEIERMLFIASLFSFDPPTDPNFFDLAISELKRRDAETTEFPKALIYAVQFLCVKGIFDYDLMNKVLSENFLADTFKRITKFSIPNNVVEIACSAKLDCLDYAGNNLESTWINEFNENFNGRSYAVTNNPSSKRDFIYMQTRIKLEELFGGPQYVHLTHVLPYSNVPHLIFCRKDNVPVVLPEEIRAKYYLDFEPASEIGDWYALEVWSAATKIGNTGEPIGSIRSKLRHLQLLGYKCILLEEEKWLDLETDKVKYLKTLLKMHR